MHRTNICGPNLHAWHGTGGLDGQLPTVLGHEMVGSVEVFGDSVTANSNGKPLVHGTRVVFPYFFAYHKCRNCLYNGTGRRNPARPHKTRPEKNHGSADSTL